MGSRKRKYKSKKIYAPAAFANNRQRRKMRIRDGGCPPCPHKFWFERGFEPCEAPRL